MPLSIVDTFADRPFGGNPAAVLELAEWLPDAILGEIARQNAQPMTGFFVPMPRQGAVPEYRLRWFSPNGAEAFACGHATFAAGALLLEDRHAAENEVAFQTEAGRLTVSRADSGRVALRFPAAPLAPAPRRPDVEQALGVVPDETYDDGSRLHLVLGTAGQVAGAEPDFAALSATGLHGVSVSAPAEDPAGPGFVLRFFHPNGGIPEDPATGSVTAALLPYWARRSGSARLEVRQLSARGGSLTAELDGAGHGVLTGSYRRYLDGFVEI